MAAFRRKKYLINKKIQLGYFGLTVWFVSLGILLVGSLTYYFALNTIINEIQSRYPNFDAWGTIRGINLILQQKLALVFVGLVIVAALLVIFYLHRVVGPVYKIEKTIHDWLNGKGFQCIRLRRKDSFTSLAEAVNAALGKIENRKNKITEILSSDLADNRKLEEIGKSIRE